MASDTRILLRDPKLPGLETIEVYEKNGGYQAYKKALARDPQETVDEVKKAGLRGRGGAGFPAGVKWGFLPKDIKPRYLCVNADESEPGTFKDRELMETDPHCLVEGTLISAFAIQANVAYIYIRGEYVAQANILEKALAEARARGHIGKNVHGSGFDVEVWVHRGAGAYICGEETGLLESLEGKRGMPRIKPPFPAVKGLFGQPTIINNVETLMNVPYIVERGGEWFASIGSDERNTGTKVMSLSGHIRTPRNWELPLGSMTVRELVEGPGGGPFAGRKLKGVIPGGSSTPVLTESELDVRLDYDSLAKAGTMLGSGGLIVMDDTTCIVRACHNLMRFYAHESCGQCTPCREGTKWTERLTREIVDGVARPDQVKLLMDIADNMAFKTICPLAEAARWPLEAFINKFPEEFEHFIATGRSMVDGDAIGGP